MNSWNLLDQRSDVFSVGVVFYELLFGARPFSGGSVDVLMQSVREDTPQPPSEAAAQVPDTLRRACFKALAKSLDDRYLYAGDLHSELTSWLASEFAKPSDVARTDITRGEIKSPGFGVVVIGTLAIAVCHGLAIVWFPENPGDNSSAACDSQGVPDSQRPHTPIDRDVAEQTIRLGASIDVNVRGEDNNYEVDSIDDIPDGDLSLTWVMFDGQTIDDEYLGRLQRLDDLEGVDLFRCTFSDSGFATLAGTGVTDEGLRSVGTMTKLEELNLDNCRVSDRGVKHLSSLVNLQLISLCETSIAAKSLEYLESCPIRKLDVSVRFSQMTESEFLATHPDCQIIRE